jgi:MFS family permease
VAGTVTGKGGWLARFSGEFGLDWLNLFVGNIQTGFGPFIAVYLTTRSWTTTSIGLALSIGTIAAIASQVPAGALVDRIANKPAVVLFSILAFGVSALLFAVNPVPLAVYVAEMLHSFSSCTLAPAIAALSLVVAAPAAQGLRFGRNARFASIGNGIGAALMGAFGYYVSERSVFFLTSALALPTLLALPSLRRTTRPNPPRSPPGAAEPRPGRAALIRLLTDRGLLTFGACAMLFNLGNAAMLPLVGSDLTRTIGAAASLVIAACVVLPQLVVALISPTVGRLAEQQGRRLVLVLGLCTVPIRGSLFAVANDPVLIMLIQILDGVAGASLGVLVPLITSDIAGRSGHFNLALGFIGLAVGIGSTVSTGLAGSIADRWGHPAAFSSLAAAGVAAAGLAWGAMPETKSRVQPSSAATQ